MLLLQLFWEFCQISVICIGGGYASMPLIQAVVVDKWHWITLTDFINVFTISQMTPGPVGINAATFCGMRVAGIPGAIAATAGFVLPSFFICLSIIYLLKKYGELPLIKGVLNALRTAVVALICVAGLSFVYIAVWNSESFPKDILAVDPIGVAILIGALIAVRRGVGVITLLAMSGAAGLILGIAMG